MAGAGLMTLTIGQAAYAQTKEPIKICVIAEAQAVFGSSIPQAAQLAADEINAKGGVDGRQIVIVSYDNHSSSAESVRAFQRAFLLIRPGRVIVPFWRRPVLKALQ